MTPKRLAELKQAVTDFPHIAPTNAEAREMVEEIEGLLEDRLARGTLAVLAEQALHAQEEHDGELGPEWINRARSAVDEWAAATGQGVKATFKQGTP